ncbi:T-cell receptor alpha chain C region [Platysternon megacephalum]|nr:T-cell receptor alpha chain C region [Platysternon megacephalum]
MTVRFPHTPFCSASCQGVNTGGYSKLTFGAGTKLLVSPDLEDSDPSVYRLKSQDGKSSACLITDFAPEDISVGSSENDITQVNGSIVQVKNPDSGKMEASYGTVLWREEKSFHCIAKHRTREFEMGDSDEEGDTCGIIELDDNFETDEKLNLLSFTLLGLRIVFVKGVAVNLLLTVWLWKS